MKVLNIGYGKQELRGLYEKGSLSSRLLYGVVQLADRYDFQDVSLPSGGGLRDVIKANLLTLQRADALFMSYLYEGPLLLLALLRCLGFYRRRCIVVISHQALKRPSGLLSRIAHRLIYRTIDNVMFHSEKNLDESVQNGLIDRRRATFFYWGDDLTFVDRTYKPSWGSYLISTGREQRDYATLIDAVKDCNVPLEIYTNRTNYANDYSFLEQVQGQYPNVSISFVEKDNDTTLLLGQRTAGALAVVIPLLRDQLTYCVGLTSIVEAMAMGKPVITTRNPYSPVDIEREGIGLIVDDEASWRQAVRYLSEHPDEARRMGQRARQLAERKFNIEATARALDGIFKRLKSKKIINYALCIKN